MPSEAQRLRAVTGNLCRCDAYLTIQQAGRIAAGADVHLWETRDADPTH
jgi:xanthine dehydrogenase iron-sulfur cluster and FAD-binding subunit A